MTVDARRIVQADLTDLPSVKELLRAADLPLDGIEDHADRSSNEKTMPA